MDKMTLRDAVHKAFGSPPILPSTSSMIEMEFERLEEAAFESGMAHKGSSARLEQDAFLEAVLLELEKTNGVRFDRARVALAASDARGEIPF